MIALPEWLQETWTEVIRGKPAQNIHEFAAENIVFDAKMGNITGPWRPDLTPYTCFFQAAVTSDFRDVPDEDWWLRNLVARGQRVDEAFVVKSSQSGLTQAALNACVYLPLFAPGRLLYVVDSKEKAKRMVKVRLLPFLHRLCGRVIADDKDVNLTFIELLDMIMEFGGSFTSGLFSEKPLKYAFADDVEYMVAEGGVPGMLDGVHVIDHIRSRFTTSDESFLGVFSKPDLESSEFIANARAGSQHSFHVPCPHCGQRQVLEPEGLNFRHKGCKDLAGRFDLDAVEALTTYKCGHCKTDIREDAKYEMNKAGVWLPKPREQRVRDDDPPMVPRRLSMRINDLNSPFPKVKWGMLARMLIESENNPAKLRYVMTNHFARPWREKAINLKAEQVRALCPSAVDPKTNTRYDVRCPPYRRGEVPFIPALMTITIDRQGDKKKWAMQAWKTDGTCAIVEYGATLSDPEILQMLDDPRSHDGHRLVCLADPDRPLIIEHGLYDSGYEMADVYETCIASGWRLYPSKGVPGVTTQGKLCVGKDDFYNGAPILIYQYNDFQLKVHFYKYKVEKRGDPRLYLPDDVDDEFVVEWISESLGPRRMSTGTTRMEWFHDSKIGPNDWGDCGKKAYVIWQILGPQIQADAAQRAREAAAAEKEGKLPEPPIPTTPLWEKARTLGLVSV